MLLKNLLIAITVAMLLVLGNTSHAENVDTVRLLELNNSLKHHRGNIITLTQDGMTRAQTNQHSVKEGELSDFILSVISEINFETESIIQRQTLQGDMQSKQGKATASAKTESEIWIFKGKCGNYLDQMNKSLDKLKDGALIFEVKSARDDIVKVCDSIQHTE